MFLDAYPLIAHPAPNSLERLFANVMQSSLKVETSNNFANSCSDPLIRIMYTINQFRYSSACLNLVSSEAHLLAPF